MPEVTIGTAAEAGVYVGTLKAVNGPKRISTRENPIGPDGSGGVEIFEWEFVLPEGETIQGSTSTATGPRSKLYGWLAALNNGRGPQPKERIELNSYIGRRVILTIEINANGYPKIVNVGAMPLEMQQQDFARTTGAPVSAPAPQQLHPQPAAQVLAPSHPQAQPPLQQSALAPADDLPF